VIEHGCCGFAEIGKERCGEVAHKCLIVAGKKIWLCPDHFDFVVADFILRAKFGVPTSITTKSNNE
jgi:hypothetical protein